MFFPLALYAQNPGSAAVQPPPQFSQTCAVCHGGDAEGTFCFFAHSFQVNVNVEH
jgi:mono/diheme cytochrome c family protein